MINKVISIGDKIDLTKSDYNFTKQKNEIYVSQVIELLDDGVIKIAAPIDGGKIIPLGIDDYYMLCFYTNKGLYRCKSKILDREIIDNQHFITVKVISNLEKYQRRQFYRLDCALPFHYKTDNKDEWIEGIIIDLSGGGLRFTCSERIDKNMKIVCKLVLEELNDIKVTGKVLTSELVPNEEIKYIHRVEFDNIETVDREKIIKFIFEEERRRRKKEKGMI
ncbi:MAG: flagellar brake protein [Eubacteriales bacterium]